MAQQITDPDALAILNSAQSQPAPSASSGITDPDALDILQQAQGGKPTQDAPDQLPTAIAHAPGRLPGVLGTINDFGNDMGDAFVHNLAKLPVSIAQNLAHQYQGLTGSAVSMADPTGLGAKAEGYIRGKVGELDNAIQKNESNYQAAVPTNTASVIGAGIGQALPFVLGGEAAAFPRAATMLGKVGMGVAGGAMLGGLQPVTTGADQGPMTKLITGDQAPSFAQQKLEQMGIGAMVGGVIPGMAQAGRGLYGAVKPLVNPSGVASDFLGNILGSKAGQVAQNLRGAPSLVPGSMPTSAQVGGVPELVQVEKALANQSPDFKTALMDRQLGNNAARFDAVQNVAGTPASLQASVAARRAAVQPQIDSLLTNGKPVDVQHILDQIQQVQQGPLGIRPTIRGALSDLHQVISGRAQDGMIAPDVLDAVRQNANDYLRHHAPNGVIGTQEGVALGPIKDQIVSSIDGANPGYSNYLANYAKLSQPVTDQRSATGILDRLNGVGLGADQRPVITLSRYNSALKAANKGPYPMSPQAQSALGGVQQDLQRESVSSSVRAPGSDTSYNLAAPGWLSSKVYGPNFAGGGTLSKLASKLPLGVGPFLTSFRDIGARNVFNAAQKLMLDPQSMAAELDKIAARNPQLARALGRQVQQQAAYTAPQLTQQH